MSPNAPVLAEEEYRKDPRIKKEDIEQLKSWMEKQPHLPKPNETTLILFYHASEYSLQRSKELLEIHYTFRTDAPEFFPCPEYEPPRYKYNVPDVCYVMQLPELSPEGYRIVYSGFRDTDPAKYQFEISLKYFTRMMQTISLVQGICPGYVTVFDISGLGIQHFSTVTISLIRKFLFMVQDAVPVRVKAVHIINVTPIIDKVMFLAKPFIKKALFEILYFHSDMNEFYKKIPKNCLPSDLGGTLPTRSEIAETTIQLLEQYSDLVDEEFKERSDETKRQNSSAISRMEGSFKKIEID